MSPTESPNPKSPQPEQEDLAGDGASGVPSDPLLQSGSFIDATTVTNGETLKPRETPDCEAPEPLQARRFVDDGVAAASTASENSNYVPPPENTESSAEPRPRRKRTSVSSVSSERPDWVPPGWMVEDRVRTSGATAGTVDKYYFDPVSGRRFRSKKEVLFFLETGSLRKRKNDPSESSGGPKQKKSSTKSKSAALNFDFHNAPEKIKWVLTDSSEGTWTPFVGETKVPESTKEEWAAAFSSLTVKSGGHVAF